MSDKTETAGATPGDDISELLRPELKSRLDRDAVELEEIDRAYQKYVFRFRPLKSGWFSDSFIRAVHEEMFRTMWGWAGKYRNIDLNLGVPWYSIRDEIQRLCGDFNYWNSSESSMDVIEIAARTQHRLTWIHPFKNGNGRHARLMTDIFLRSRGHPTPKWPQIQLITDGEEIRRRYIAAMKEADRGDLSLLIALMKGWI